MALIIDPLKSLMRDQKDNLNALGIDTTVFINSSLTPKERIDASEEMIKGFFQFVFISPERLQIDEFRKYLSKMNQIYFTYSLFLFSN